MILRDMLKQAQRSADGHQIDLHHGGGNDGEQALSAVYDIVTLLEEMITRIEKLEGKKASRPDWIGVF